MNNHTTRIISVFYGSNQRITLTYDERILSLIGKPVVIITSTSGSGGPGSVTFEQRYEMQLVIIKSNKPIEEGEPFTKIHTVHIVASTDIINTDHLHYLGSLYVNATVWYAAYEEIKNL